MLVKQGIDDVVEAGGHGVDQPLLLRLDDAHAQGVDDVVGGPPGFTTSHLEVSKELDRSFRPSAYSAQPKLGFHQ